VVAELEAELVEADAVVEEIVVEETVVDEVAETAVVEPEVEEPESGEAAAEEPAAEELAPKPVRTKRRPVRATAPESPASEAAGVEVALSVQGLSKYFGGSPAVDDIDLEVAAGSFYGIVGPNGAGKTTTLSMITGLLRPDDGVVRVFGLDVWENASLAKRKIGVLPDRLRLFDRLTGAEFLYHAGALRGLDRATIAQRSADLSAAFGLEHSLHRLVSDYSAGMTKKIAIAAAMIHAPRLLVLDEPFESVDPVSSAVVIGVLKRFVEAGGTVILSSHSMELTERVCDGVAIIAGGEVLAEGPLEKVLDGRSLEERFVELAGGEAAVKGMEWLQNFSD
jgi:ABC-2 type transport system ATP-binding protein